MDIATALAELPSEFMVPLREAYGDGGDMAYEMLRRGDMPAARALLAGLALDPIGRDSLERTLDQVARPSDELPSEVVEVIVGGGAHAAIYAATRTQRGLQPPLVLEKERRFGGTFAMTQRSSFFLNSRNRPGALGAPGSRDALNVIVGAPMQPSDLGGSEYQANADLGLVVRCALAMNATVRTATVKEIARNGEQLLVLTDRGVVRANRVIVATGLGERRSFATTPYDGKRVLTFEQLMRRFDTTNFPLRGLGRVAVIGGGDSGRTAVEALAGYGPPVGGSVASLDYVERIDWYGVGEGMTKQRWLECNRTRYKPIAALFPSNDNTTRNARVRGLARRQNGYVNLDTIVVNGESYDTMVSCADFPNTWDTTISVDGSLIGEMGPLRPVAGRGVMLARTNADRSLVIVGPAAKLDFEQVAETTVDIPENRVALFRLAPRTSAVAMLLP